MGDFTFQRGDLDTIMLTVLRLSSTVPDYPADYTLPRVRVSHVNGGNEVEDLAFTDMVQMGSSNRWYYKHNIGLGAAFTRYLVTFETTIEGVATQATEEFRVTTAPNEITGTGEYPITIQLQDENTFQPLVGVILEFYDKNNQSLLLAQTSTDNAGNGTVYLNTGSYLVRFSKSGNVTEVHTLVVDAIGNYTLDGN
jgi:hypothetical protein